MSAKSTDTILNTAGTSIKIHKNTFSVLYYENKKQPNTATNV